MAPARCRRGRTCRRRAGGWPSRVRSPRPRARACASGRRRCRRSPGSTLPCWRTARRRPAARRPRGRSRARPWCGSSRALRSTRSSPRRGARAGVWQRPRDPSHAARAAVSGTTALDPVEDLSEFRPSEFRSSPRFWKIGDLKTECKFFITISVECFQSCFRYLRMSDRHLDSNRCKRGSVPIVGYGFKASIPRLSRGSGGAHAKHAGGRESGAQREPSRTGAEAEF